MIYKYEFPEFKEIDIDGVISQVKAQIHGHVEIDVPKYTQRLKYIQECKFKLDEKGMIKVDMSGLDSIVKMIEFAKKHITNVDLTNSETGMKYTKFDDLEDDNSCDTILNDIGGVILSGVKLGKSLKPQ